MWKAMFRYPLVVLLGLTTLYGAEQIGIIGGSDLSLFPYAAFVDQNGIVTDLSPSIPLSFGEIFSVGINSMGAGIIAGHSGVALVAPNGSLTIVSGGTFPATTGDFSSAAINDSGKGIVGGQDSMTTFAYAAFIAPDGTPTSLGGSLFPSQGNIRSVAINNSGIGIIGGEDSAGPISTYAERVDADGTLIPLVGSPLPVRGFIRSVAINSLGSGIIGGQDDNGNFKYGGLVSPNAFLTPITGLNFSSSHGSIASVAISDTGTAIIGGFTIVIIRSAYAALVSPDGIARELSSSNFPMLDGVISSVAINSSGEGIIGGQNLGISGPAYAAFVSPQGILREIPLSTVVPDGVVFTVAINEAGLGLIAAESAGISNYAALVAPNGVLTPLTGNGFSSTNLVILQVALKEVAIPTSIGSLWNAINSQLAAAYALESHLITSIATDPFALNDPCCNQESIACSTPYTLWLSPFGASIKQNATGSNSSLRDDIGGALLGFDYRIPDSTFLFGTGIGYSYNSTHYGNEPNRGTLQEELLFVYSAYQRQHFWINAALWGGLYQMTNKRYTLSSIRSTTGTDGWLFTPHLEVAAPLSIFDDGILSFEPFAMADFVNNWQHHFTEHGASGLNLQLTDQWTSVLRSEVGFRFYQALNYSYGTLLLQEKVSYINQKPFHAGSVTTSFVSSSSSFPIAIGSSHIQNLGGFTLHASFLPKNNSLPYVSIDLSKESGFLYRAYFLNLEIGKNF